MSKLCPISFSSRMLDCREEKCAWWDDDRCAVLSIADQASCLAGDSTTEVAAAIYRVSDVIAQFAKY